MTPVQTAEQALRDGNVDAALKSLQDAVRAKADDPKLRVFLFQLLCVLGQWPRALNQLDVCMELDPSTLPMVSTYREALKCESLREAVFAGRNTPMVFGRPAMWVALLVEALQVEARGDAAGAARLRNEALEAAPPTPGTIDGTPFEWIADGDSRLGPVLEAVINGRYSWVPLNALVKIVIEEPADLRDLVWSAAQLEFVNGGSTVALIPTRYPGSATSADGAIRLARRTDWLPLAEPHFAGLGQRVFTTDNGDTGILQAREILLQPAPVAEDDEPTADAAA